MVFPTTTPAACLEQAAEFFRQAGDVAAVGIGSFGPVSLRKGTAAYGSIAATPKQGWTGTDLVAPMRDALAVPIVIDTDVNAGALAEF